MFPRYIKLSKTHSFFLFGPRGSGKSTLLRQTYVTPKTLYVDLLEDRYESRYRKNPDLLLADIKALSDPDWIIIDEIQKIPKLLDLVHKAIEELKVKFILTGSSARKLKRDGANLLAGRAFLFHLFPLTSFELGKRFDLLEAISWGTLPAIYSFKDKADKKNYLLSYTKGYIKEEILQEQVIRNIDGFRNFLEIAAQMNGKLLNFSKIGREAGVEGKTIRSYYQILEDTLMGFFIPAYHKSVRKSQTFQPKFYFFDLGAVRTLEGTLDSAPVPSTSMYGQYFESFVINEIFRINSYSQKEYRLFHYQTSTNQEIDLILSKGKKTILVEIKSSKTVDKFEVSAFERLATVFEGAEYYFVSQDPIKSVIGKVRCLHWRDFIQEIFLNDYENGTC